MGIPKIRVELMISLLACVATVAAAYAAFSANSVSMRSIRSQDTIAINSIIYDSIGKAMGLTAEEASIAYKNFKDGKTEVHDMSKLLHSSLHLEIALTLHELKPNQSKRILDAASSFIDEQTKTTYCNWGGDKNKHRFVHVLRHAEKLKLTEANCPKKVPAKKPS